MFLLSIYYPPTQYDGTDYQPIQVPAPWSASTGDGTVTSTSLTPDGMLLAVGSSSDDNGMGAVWVFRYIESKNSAYHPVGERKDRGKGKGMAFARVIFQGQSQPFLHISLSPPLL